MACGTPNTRFSIPSSRNLLPASFLCITSRRIRAQIVLATAARGRAARLETSSRRAMQTARQRQLDREAAAEREEAARLSEEAARLISPHGEEGCDMDNHTATSATTVVGDDSEDAATTTTPGVVRLERVVTIDGTEVHLTANVKNGGGTNEHSCKGGNDQPMEMLLVAVDKKARRSSRLSLDAADIAEIVGTDQDSSPGSKITNGAQRAVAAVLQKLTVFNSRRKDLFILSYKGRKVVAPH